MSWKPEVYVEGAWSQNALVFATREEAAQNAADLYMRWTAVSEHRAVESTEPVNYRYVDHHLEAVEPITAGADVS